MIKVTIVVPVYNVEKYIVKCIDSVIKQTYKNLEILIINDGTKDNSIKIIENLFKDNRIKIINKINGGLSSARNRGILEATGEYIFFLDGDDWLEENTIELLIKNIDNTQIIGANYYLYDEETKNKKKLNLKLKYNIKEKGIYLFQNEMEVIVCNKLYKVSFLKENNLFFKEKIIHEDEEFTFKCYMLADKIKYIKDYTYNYRRNREHSITTDIALGEKNNSSIQSLEIIINEINNFQKDKKEYFIKIRSLLRKYILKIRIAERKRILLNKEIVLKFQEEIRNIEFRKMNSKEKEIVKKEIREILNKKEFYDVRILNWTLWRNKIIDLKLLRRILKKKISLSIMRKSNENIN